MLDSQHFYYSHHFHIENNQNIGRRANQNKYRLVLFCKIASEATCGVYRSQKYYIFTIVSLNTVQCGGRHHFLLLENTKHLESSMDGINK